MIRVLIVDDHGLARAGLRMILEAQADIEVVGVATDGAEAVKAVRQLVVDVALMDIQMAGVSGLEAARLLAALPSQRPVRVLIVTAFDLDEYIDEALAIGVSGFIVKSASPEELVAAVRAVAAGEAYLGPSVTRRVMQAFARRGIKLADELSQLSSLTQRELDVLRCLARGLSNREIARELSISETTVRTHVGHVLAKLDLRDRIHAVVRAHEMGVLDATVPAASTRGAGRDSHQARSTGGTSS
jgi:DNA-binding NarL/FixJ family response regulator